MIRIENLSKTYANGTEALTDVSFEIRNNEIMLLLGPNGAGKSTTIRILMGLCFASRGSFSPPLAPLYVGYVPEGDVGKRGWTAIAYLDFLGRLRGMGLLERRKASMFLLRRLGIEDAANKKMSELSKGMKQRFKWVQALLHDPEFLVLDEPTSDLDPVGKKEIRDMILELKTKGKTILLCSHLLAEAEKCGDRFVVLDHGRVVASGLVDEVLQKGSLEDHFLSLLKPGEVGACQNWTSLET